MYFEADIKEIGIIDTIPIKKLIKTVSESVWNSDTRRLNNSNFDETHTLWLRRMPMTEDGIFHVFDHLKMCNNVELEDEINKFHLNIENLLNGFIIRSSIIRLEPSKHVHLHVDGTHPMFIYGRRIIVPIITNPDVIFKYQEDDEDRVYYLKEGVMYDTNGFIPHCTVNNGISTRYQFVLDLLPNLSNDKTPLINFYKTWTPKQYETIVALVPPHCTNTVLPDWKTIRNEQKQIYNNQK
jgi:hypothetical protein